MSSVRINARGIARSTLVKASVTPQGGSVAPAGDFFELNAHMNISFSQILMRGSIEPDPILLRKLSWESVKREIVKQVTKVS